MNDIKIMSWKEVFWASPGPRTVGDAVLLVLKGLGMGAVNILPGISGGTVALTTGIYADLLRALKSAGFSTLKKLMGLDIKGALAEIHIRFLVFLMLGIVTAILTLSEVVNYLAHKYPVLIWSLLFGFIAASIFTIGKQVKDKAEHTALSFFIGAASTWFFVGFIPISTPEDLWSVFFTGIIAISAIIFPGFSSVFFLLILSKYQFITDALKNPFLQHNFMIIIVFFLGGLCGLVGFSRILNYILTRWHSLTLSCLAGLMAGTMKKLWPWKKLLEEKIVSGKLQAIQEQNIFPPEFNGEFILAVCLMVAGFIAVLFLEQLSTRRKRVEEKR